MATKTTAEQIAQRLGDGETWACTALPGEPADEDGEIGLHEMAVAAGASVEEADDVEHNGMTSFYFPDGSVITSAEGGWDIGYTECWCWRGVGHADDCERRTKRPAGEAYDLTIYERSADGLRTLVGDGQTRYWVDSAALAVEVEPCDGATESGADQYARWCIRANAGEA